MKKYRSVRDFDVAGKTVILRTDFNVPIVQGKITDHSRITRSMATINYLMHHRAKTIILSHYGRPKGNFNPDMSLAPIVDAISAQMNGKEIKFSLDILSKTTEQQIKKMKDGEILIAENIRFHIEEEENDDNFAKKIAALGDYYINDAFSCSHRAHASIEAITKYIPAAAGLLAEEELTSLHNILEKNHDIFVITGGAKVSSKIDLLKNLINKAKFIVIGGAMANTFLKAKNYNIGNSLYEENHLQTAQEIILKAKENQCELILPSDVITAKKIDGITDCQVIDIENVSNNEMILDIGPQTIIDIIEKLKKVSTVIWNGPLGAFEYKPFDMGTMAIARAISKFTKQNKLTSVAGGGDIVSAINQAGLEKGFSYISTGGGAFLEWLEGKEMPGIQALIKNYERTKNLSY
jgi:phosphoglycerate kinase